MTGRCCALHDVETLCGAEDACCDACPAAVMASHEDHRDDRGRIIPARAALFTVTLRCPTYRAARDELEAAR